MARSHKMHFRHGLRASLRQRILALFCMPRAPSKHSRGDSHDKMLDPQNEKDQFGLTGAAVATAHVPAVPHVDAVIVGAGWAGLWSLYRLRQLGFNCLCIEAHSDVGGVWLYTKYPGCRNETETPVYQFSAKETWESWNWTERFPAQRDVHRYMRHTADVLNLVEDMMFNTRISRAAWDPDAQQWSVYSDDRLLVTTKFFIPCTGYAGQKYVPDIKGLDAFEHAYHTSEWTEHTEYKGKRVAVIGTGSSGMQSIETIGPDVKHLTVFQRTPNLANPRHQQYLTSESEAAEQKDYAKRYLNMNKTPTGLEVKPLGRNAFDDTPEQRQRTYEDLWSKGAQHFWFGNYNDLLTSKAANDAAYAFWRDKTRPRINDPVKRDLLAPLQAPHAFGTKRPSLESSYFEVYNQPNVDLVDVKHDPIVEVTPQGIRTASGQLHEVDVILLATGYDFGIGSQLAIDIRGVNNVSLREKWGLKDWPKRTSPSNSEGVKTQLGIVCAGFPNMLLSCGPQAPTAFGITPRLAELQVDWMAKCMDYVRAHGTTIDTTEEAENRWKRKNEDAVKNTLITGTDGWYMGNNIPGRKKEALFWFGGVPEYMAHCEESAKNGYEGFVIR